MLVFDPVKHAYTNKFTGEEYISATTLLNKYKKPFDSATAAERVSKREGVTAEETLEKWKKQNNESKKYGSTIHSIIEQYNKSKTIVEGYDQLIESYRNLNVINDTDELLVEEQVVNHAHKLAGTADIIRLEKNGGYSIFDIKTNKRFNFYSLYREKMLYPVDHLSACEYSLYSLQLSLYAYMYTGMTGRNLHQLGIFYYDREVNTFTYYPVVYLKTDILKIIEHYRR